MQHVLLTFIKYTGRRLKKTTFSTTICGTKGRFFFSRHVCIYSSYPKNTKRTWSMKYSSYNTALVQPDEIW